MLAFLVFTLKMEIELLTFLSLYSLIQITNGGLKYLHTSLDFQQSYYVSFN